MKNEREKQEEKRKRNCLQSSVKETKFKWAIYFVAT